MLSSKALALDQARRLQGWGCEGSYAVRRTCYFALGKSAPPNPRKANKMEM